MTRSARALSCTLGASLLLTPLLSRADEPPASPRPVTVAERSVTDDGTILAKLSNGLTVIVRPVHTAPVVNVRGYVRAGGLYEGRWLGCGLSHLLEHLVAKDAVSGGEGHIRSKHVDKRSRSSRIGAQANAYTSQDHTCYYISAAADKTDECIDIIADQLARPDITPEDFQREHGVVQRELEMGRDDPSRVMYYAHQANLYRSHPASVPVIGFAEPLAAVTMDDVLEYHKLKYQPQNMVFVVAGDIDPQAALTRTVECFAGFARGRQTEYTLPEVPAVSGTRRLVRPSPRFQEAAQMMSFQTIPLLHDDLYPLDVLSTVLSQGRASRLVKTLQFERKLVTSISTYSATPAWGKGAFTVSFRCDPAHADEAEAAVRQQLQAVIDEGVNEDELARAKRQMVSHFVRSRQKIDDIASTLGHDYLVAGDLAFSRNYTDRIQQVTAGQVQDTARKYLRLDDVVMTRMVPADTKTDLATPQADTAESHEATVYRLNNGMRVVLKPTPAVGLVSMVLATKGGMLRETPGTNGLGALMMALSPRGAGGRSAEQIDAFFNNAGGSIGGTCGDNTYLYSASILSDRYTEEGTFAEALDVFANVILEPDFPQAELERIRPTARAQILRTDENWQGKLQKLFRRKFFTDSPWSLLNAGSLEVIESATTKQIADFHTNALHPADTVLAIYGHFDESAARKIVEDRFGPIEKSSASLTLPEQRTVADGGERYVQPTKTQQAGVIVAAPGTTVTNLEDRLPLMILDTLISGYRMPGGWLHTELRGKRLVYVVHSYHKVGLAPGAFVTYAGTQPDKAREVVDIITKNLRKAADYTPTQEEIDRAITTIVTAEVLSNQTVGELATQAALDELYELGVDWPRKLRPKLRAVTPRQVRDAARKYLGGDYVVTIITPAPNEFPEATVVEDPRQVE